MTTPGDDLAAVLHDHHERIDQMLGNVASAAGDDRRAVFWWLRRFLAAHDAAEQVFIHPWAPTEPGDEALPAPRLLEESTAADLIARLEEIDVDSGEFERLLAELHLTIGKHARAEELQELPQIVEATQPAEIDRMRQALDHVDVLVSHRNGPLGERVRPYASVLASAKTEFRAMRAQRGV